MGYTRWDIKEIARELSAASEKIGEYERLTAENAQLTSELKELRFRASDEFAVSVAQLVGHPLTAGHGRYSYSENAHKVLDALKNRMKRLQELESFLALAGKVAEASVTLLVPSSDRQVSEDRDHD